MTQIVIANGPSKFELMVSLFDGRGNDRRVVNFTLNDGRKLNLTINMIRREDRSEEEWMLEGHGTFNCGRMRLPMDGFFSTATRLGIFNVTTSQTAA